MDKPAPRKLALFGGTFDPPHLGHIAMARAAVDMFSLDEVRFLPCRISPHKPGRRPADGSMRVEMLQLATRDFPWAVTDPRELEAAAPSYSYLTAEGFAREFPHDRLFWLMGVDQWDCLPAWMHPERIAAVVEFIVAWRAGRPPGPLPGFRMHPLPFDHPASATRIRAMVAGGNIYPEWLDPRVAEFVAKARLYRHRDAP